MKSQKFILNKIKNQQKKLEKLVEKNNYLNKLKMKAPEEHSYAVELASQQDLKGFYIRKVEDLVEIAEKNCELKRIVDEKYRLLSLQYKNLREKLDELCPRVYYIKKSCVSLEQNLVLSQRQSARSLSRLESKEYLLRNQLLKAKHEEMNLNSLLSKAHKVISPVSRRLKALRSKSQYKLPVLPFPSNPSQKSRSPISLPINFA